MLKNRILTVLVLVPIVIAGIFFLPPLAFFSLALLLILLAGWEWTGLAGIKHPLLKWLFLILLLAILLSVLFIPISIIVTISLIWWLFAFVLLLIYPKASQWWGESTLIKSIMGFLVLVPCWIGLVILQGFSPVILMFCLVIIWSVDTAAYFVGKKWGKHKLAPAISPGKTYEGLLGGLLATLILSGIGIWLFNIPLSKWWLFSIICLVGGGLISVFGDLFESMVKRKSNVKDSGTLLPGHGGILDRIDSMTTAIPFFALILPYFFNSY